MPQTIVEKIAQAPHGRRARARPLRAGDFLSIRPVHVMTHDNTSAVMKKFKAHRRETRARSHAAGFRRSITISRTRTEANLAKYRAHRDFAREHGIDFYPAGTGIGHQIMVEKGYVHARLLRGRLRLALQHVRRAGRRRHAGRAHRRRRHLGHRRVLVADSAHRAGRARRQAPDGRDRQGLIITLCGLYNHEEVSERRGRIHRPGRGRAQHGRAAEHRQHDAPSGARWSAGSRWTRSRLATWSDASRRLRAARRGALPEEDIARLAQRIRRCRSGCDYAARIVLDLSESRRMSPGPDTVQVMQSVAEIAKKQESPSRRLTWFPA